MRNNQDHNILLLWLPSGGNYNNKSNDTYFKQAKSGIKCLLEKQIVTSVDSIIFLASSFKNTPEEDGDTYKLIQDKEFLKDSIIRYNHEYRGSLKLDKLYEYQKKLQASHKAKYGDEWCGKLESDIPYEDLLNNLDVEFLNIQFEGIVKIIIPVTFATKTSITDEQVIFTNIKNILGDIVEVKDSTTINLHVLVSTGTPPMRTTWLLSKYNNLFKSLDNENLNVTYWNNQIRDNNITNLKEAFQIDENSLFKGTENGNITNNNDHNSHLKDIFENGTYKERITNFKKYLTNYYLEKFDNNVDKTADYLQVDSKTIRNNKK